MFISDFAIRRPIITVVTMIALVVFGLASLARLDTDEFPDIDAPIVFVAIAYPGAAPDVVERAVVSRVEDKISGISGVDKINSSSTDGFAQIIVQFVFSKPVDQATQDIRDAISAVRAQLPAEILEPIIQRFDPNQLPIVSLAVTSSVLTPPQLTQIELRGPMREETNSWLNRVALGVPTQHATAAEGHHRLMLTKAIDLSARLERPVKLPISPEDEKAGR